MKHTKVSASLLGLTLVSGALVAGPVAAEAATKIKTVTTTSSSVSKSGKLVSKKTGKVVKGYALFKGKVYKNGVKFTGVLNSKYYKSGSKATALYKGKYYKKGSLATASYKNIYYVKGKVANGVFNKKYYSKGKLATGVYKKLYYVKGGLFSGKKGNVQYVKGVNKGAYEIENPFVLRKYYIINQASELPTTVTVTNSKGVSVMQKVTWTMDEKDQSSITLKDGVLTGTTNGEYVLTGTVANSKIKQKLYVVIADAEETFASINQSIEELLKFEKLVEEAKKNKLNPKVQTSEASTTAQSDINFLFGALFNSAADASAISFFAQNITGTLLTVPSPGVPSPGVPSPGVPSPGIPSAGLQQTFTLISLVIFGPIITAPAYPELPGAATAPLPTPLTPVNSMVAASALNGLENANGLLQTVLGNSNQMNATQLASQLNAGLIQINNFQGALGGLGTNLIPPAVVQAVGVTTNQTQKKIDAINNPTPVDPGTGGGTDSGTGGGGPNPDPGTGGGGPNPDPGTGGGGPNPDPGTGGGGPNPDPGTGGGGPNPDPNTGGGGPPIPDPNDLGGN